MARRKSMEYILKQMSIAVDYYVNNEPPLTFSFSGDRKYSTDDTFKDNKIETGFTAGLNYSISRHLGLTVRYLFFGMTDVEEEYDDARLGGGHLILDASQFRLQFGIQLVF